MGTRWVVHEGDCVALANDGREHVFDAIVCDPPYELTSIVKRFGKNGSAPAKFGSDGRFTRLSGGFMGQKWDSTGVSFDPATWAALLRVAKPGAHLIAFGGTRTFHRLMVAIEDGGWDVRECLMWLYGTGFPKSHDVSKGIDAMFGAEREVVGTRTSAFGTATPGGVWNERFGDGGPGLWVGSDPKEVALRGGAVSDEAKRWEGWGTALKPAWEPIVLARAPLSEPTIAANVLKWGTGAINIEATRIGTTREVPASLSKNKTPNGIFGEYGGGHPKELNPNVGRWPANVVLDEIAAARLDVEVGERHSSGVYNAQDHGYVPNGIGFGGKGTPATMYADKGGPSRFFYTAKASASERALADGTRHNHPTTKPVSLMRWLVRLVTPPNGIVLDPFAGSGSTGVAVLQEGFRFVGIDLTPEYAKIARKRLAEVEAKIAERSVVS